MKNDNPDGYTTADGRQIGGVMKRLTTIGTATLAISVFGATTVFAEDKVAVIAAAFRDACIQPLVMGTPIADDIGLMAMEPTAPDGINTGRKWRVIDAVTLTEKNANGYRGCTLAPATADGLDKFAEGSPEDAAKFWAAFEIISKSLLQSGDFVPRTSHENPKRERMMAIESANLNEKGNKVVAFVSHDLESNYAFAFAGETGGGT